MFTSLCDVSQGYLPKWELGLWDSLCLLNRSCCWLAPGFSSFDHVTRTLNFSLPASWVGGGGGDLRGERQRRFPCLVCYPEQVPDVGDACWADVLRSTGVLAAFSLSYFLDFHVCSWVWWDDWRYNLWGAPILGWYSKLYWSSLKPLF